MTSDNNKNKLINHLTITSCDYIAEIMMPKLAKHGITVFNYYKNYFDGSGVRFSTHREWSKRYIEKGYNLNTTVPASYLQNPINYFIWQIKDCPHMLIDAVTNFDIANGITIARRNKDSIESFAFGSNANNTSIVNFYLNNLDILQSYCDYFKDQAAPLLAQGEKNKICLTMNDIHHDNNSLPKILNLSDRQLECANLLSNGLKIKEISRNLDLSTRTVEHYIDTLKIKLSCSNLNELIIKLMKIKYL